MANAKQTKDLKAEIVRLSGLLKEKNRIIGSLSRTASYDFLSGLYNRHGFVAEAEKFLEEAKNYNAYKGRRRFAVKNFAVIYIDLDNLKTVNDTYGHGKGDKFIKEVSKIFKKSVRDIDVVSRWGGDEFVIGLVDADSASACAIAEKIRMRMSKLKIAGIPSKHKFTASFGAISAVKKGRESVIFDLHKLVATADSLMYHAKKKMGKNFVACF